jgi:predicted SnoaL-like aldol condensation-catalyzing enzyme
MYEVFLKADGKEIFVGYFKNFLEIENLKKEYPNKEFVIYKVITDFGDLSE